MSAQTRIRRRDYTGCLSLRTTDHCRTKSLLPSFSPSNTIGVSRNEKNAANNVFLCELANALSSLECAEIVENGNQCLFENMSDKYKFGKQRNSSRLLVLDEILARNLWKNIEPVLSKEKLDILKQPLGFSVRGEWELHGLNEAMRISKYSSANKEFFAPHKDAQYCPNGDERSLLTLLVYLNDGSRGGETCFYFPKDATQNVKGMTTQEEIDVLGGLKEGFNCVKIKPKVGHAVLFSHNILHESLPVLRGTKYILKTDVVVKQHSFGFAVETGERNDYLMCLNHFRSAQQKELVGNFDEASSLYERALSIRYCYPKYLLEAANDPDPVLNRDDDVDCPSLPSLPHSVWKFIFDFLSGADQQCFVDAFPHFIAAKQSSEKHERSRCGRKYLPKVIYQKGFIIKFEFSDADFFSENADGCCRVAAMYSFFLLGHKAEDDVYIVRFDPGTQIVCAVTLDSFLSDAFFNRRSRGSLYNVRQQDPEKNPKKELEDCVDRNYMLLRHGTEFFGVELPDSFYAKSTAHPAEREEDEEGKEAAATTKQVNISEEKITPQKLEGNCDGSVPFYDDDDIAHSVSAEHLLRLFTEVHAFIESKPDALEVVEVIGEKRLNMMNDGDDGDVVFFDALKGIIATPSSVSCALTSTLQETLHIGADKACVCQFCPNVELIKRINKLCKTEFFNHLVFDFSEGQLSVKRDAITENELFSPRRFESISDEQKTLDFTGEASFYRVHIEPIVSPAGSFNHASCQCAHPRFEVHEFCSLKGYPYLTDVHLEARELGGKMLVWSVYCGVVAL